MYVCDNCGAKWRDGNNKDCPNCGSEELHTEEEEE